VSSTLPARVRVHLAWKSVGVCAFPGCHKRLYEDGTDKDDAANLGEAAHIVGEKLGAARHDPNYPSDKLNKYENLLYLCRDHHRLIDMQGNTYTTDQIRGWKTEHENKFSEMIEDVIPDVSFKELQIVTDAILAKHAPVSGRFTLTAPIDKMKKNDLTIDSSYLITMGLGQSREVSEYIKEASVLMPKFIEELIAGFKNKYDELIMEDYLGDDLFNQMHRFACNGNGKASVKAAGLAVLVHLFETCEVFEP
jgi:hypothetical protein